MRAQLCLWGAQAASLQHSAVGPNAFSRAARMEIFAGRFCETPAAVSRKASAAADALQFSPEKSSGGSGLQSR